MWSRARVARLRAYTGRTGKSWHGKLLAMQKGNAHRETQAQEQVPSMDTVGTGSPGVEVPAAPLKGAATLAAPAAPLRAAAALAAPLKSAAASSKKVASLFQCIVEMRRLVEMRRRCGDDPDRSRCRSSAKHAGVQAGGRAATVHASGTRRRGRGEGTRRCRCRCASGERSECCVGVRTRQNAVSAGLCRAGCRWPFELLEDLSPSLDPRTPEVRGSRVQLRKQRFLEFHQVSSSWAPRTCGSKKHNKNRANGEYLCYET
jgi:hypothetical protein